MSGSAIAMQEIGFGIRQPTLKDISVVGEQEFYQSIAYFFINRDKLSLEIEVDDFELLLYVCLTNEDIKTSITNLLMLTIDDVESISFEDFYIDLKIAGHGCIIDESKFLMIKDIYKQIFCLEGASEEEFNPADEAARRIAEKLRKRKEKIAGQSPKSEATIFSNFISILVIGPGSLSISDCLNLTVFQIYNLIKRFNLHSEYQMQMQALMQGAENIELVDWTKQI